MKIKKILCPVDFSGFSNSAREFATLFAAASGAEIVFLHVAEQGASDDDYAIAMQRKAEHALARLVTIEPTSVGIKFSHDVKVCSLVADTIVEYANEHGCDLIVIATHGRTGLRRLFLGSVAEAVMRKANCVVATLRPEWKYFEPESGHECSAGLVSSTAPKESLS